MYIHRAGMCAGQEQGETGCGTQNQACQRSVCGRTTCSYPKIACSFPCAFEAKSITVVPRLSRCAPGRFARLCIVVSCQVTIEDATSCHYAQRPPNCHQLLLKESPIAAHGCGLVLKNSYPLFGTTPVPELVRHHSSWCATGACAGGPRNCDRPSLPRDQEPRRLCDLGRHVEDQAQGGTVQ